MALRTSLLFFILGLTATRSASARVDITAESFQKQFNEQFAKQKSIEHAQYEHAQAFLKAANYIEENSSLAENPDIYATGCSEVSPQCEDHAYVFTVTYRANDQRVVLISVGGVAIDPRTKKLLLIREQMTKLCFNDSCDSTNLNSDLKN